MGTAGQGRRSAGGRQGDARCDPRVRRQASRGPSPSRRVDQRTTRPYRPAAARGGPEDRGPLRRGTRRLHGGVGRLPGRRRPGLGRAGPPQSRLAGDRTRALGCGRGSHGRGCWNSRLIGASPRGSVGHGEPGGDRLRQGRPSRCPDQARRGRPGVRGDRASPGAPRQGPVPRLPRRWAGGGGHRRSEGALGGGPTSNRRIGRSSSCWRPRRISTTATWPELRNARPLRATRSPGWATNWSEKRARLVGRARQGARATGWTAPGHGGRRGREAARRGPRGRGARGADRRLALGSGRFRGRAARDGRRPTEARGTDLVRASGWLAHGLEHELASDRGGVLRACGRGLGRPG